MSTTSLAMTAETGVGLIFFAIVFLAVLLFVLYLFWPVKNDVLNVKGRS